MNFNLLQEKLDRSLIDPKVFLSTAKVMDVSSRESPAYNDRRYLPFYYHLGNQLEIRDVYQVGPMLGLVGVCFLSGCKTVENWTAVDLGDCIRRRNLTQSNLMKYVKNISVLSDVSDIGERSLDLGLVTEEVDEEKMRVAMEKMWNGLRSEGLLVVDYICRDASKKVFHDFSRVKNREPIIFNSRYSVGILQR